MNLHEEFYDFSKRVRNQFEELVQIGCDHIGEFSISVGELHLEATDKRSGVIIGDNTSIVIYGIVKDENYSIHPKKNSEKDISVITNTIKVIVEDFETRKRKEIEVRNRIFIDLRELSTYISGGFATAQYERALIQERVVAGLAAAKRRGRIGGRPLAITGEKLDAITAALNGGMSKAAVCRNFGVKRTTLIETLARVGWTSRTGNVTTMTSKNKLLTVLSDAEQYALYGLPDFDDAQRLEYLSLSETELALASSRPGLHAQVYCVLQIGYFKAKHAFFRFAWDEVEDDCAFVLSRYFNGEAFEPQADHQARALHPARR